MKWLANIFIELVNNTKKMERQKQFLSIISLLVVYRKLRTNCHISTLKEEALLQVFNMAYVSPSGEEYYYLKKWMKTPESKYLYNSFYCVESIFIILYINSSRNEVRDTLVELFIFFRKKVGKGRNLHLVLPMLKIVPLIHFLRGSSAPFTDQQMDVFNISWDDSTLNTKALRDAFHDESAG